MTQNDIDILQKIKELIPQAPGYWADVISSKMKRTLASVYYYANGERGIRKGCHKEVLRLLIELVEKENKNVRKLTEDSQALINKMNDNQ